MRNNANGNFYIIFLHLRWRHQRWAISTESAFFSVWNDIGVDCRIVDRGDSVSGWNPRRNDESGRRNREWNALDVRHFEMSFWNVMHDAIAWTFNLPVAHLKRQYGKFRKKWNAPSTGSRQQRFSFSALCPSNFEFCCCLCGIAVFLHSLALRYQFYLNKFFLIDHYLVIFIALSAADAAILLAVHEWTTFCGLLCLWFFVNEQRQSVWAARREQK